MKSDNVDFFRMGCDALRLLVEVIFSTTGANVALLRGQHCFINNSTGDWRDIGADDIVTQHCEREAVKPSERINLSHSVLAYIDFPV